jgi:hypothetical protein
MRLFLLVALTKRYCALTLTLDAEINVVRAKTSRYLSTVLTREEIRAIFDKLSGVNLLVIKLFYDVACD